MSIKIRIFAEDNGMYSIYLINDKSDIEFINEQFENTIDAIERIQEMRQDRCLQLTEEE